MDRTGDNAEQALKVLQWAKDNGVPLQSVRVGADGCAVELFAPAAAGDGKREQPRAPTSIYSTFGGEAWKHAVRSGDIEAPRHGAGDDEDLEPAVEARG